MDGTSPPKSNSTVTMMADLTAEVGRSTVESEAGGAETAEGDGLEGVRAGIDPVLEAGDLP